MSSRDVVLRRVRAALGRSGPAGHEAQRSGGAAPVVPLEDAGSYRRTGDLPTSDLVDLFAERAGDYRVTVRRVEEGALAATIADELGQRGAKRVVAPADLPEVWRDDGVRWLLDGPGDGTGTLLELSDIDGCDGVVTGCALAVAETGTIVFDGGWAQGRRVLTLLPDLHLCVVYESQIVQTVPEAVQGSSDAVRAGAPITLVSGPSATSDIELERVEGVHGPRTLVILLVR